MKNIKTKNITIWYILPAKLSGYITSQYAGKNSNFDKKMSLKITRW